MAKKETNPRLKIKFDPEGRRVRLDELRRLLHDLTACLDHLAGIALNGKRPPKYAVTDLFAGSAGLEVAPDETRPVDGKKVLVRFKRTARELYADNGNGDLDAKTLELFRKLAFPATKQQNRLWFDDMSITTQFLANIDKRLERPVRAYGQIKGVLERVNVHGTNEFVVYSPLVTSGIRCVFPERLTHKVGGSLKKSVTVRGAMHYRGDEPLPFLVEVDEIVAHPADSKLPSLGSLKGMAPSCTGKMNSLDFIRSLQND